MKLVSTLALAAALTIGGTAAIAKEKPAAPPAAPAPYAFQLGKPFRAAAAPAQAALKAGDKVAAAEKIAAAEAVATTPDEKYVVAQFRLQLAGLSNDQAMQRQAVDAMIASGSGGAAADLGKLNFYSGQFAYQAGDFARAQARLAEAERLGYVNSDMYLLLAESSFKTNQTAAGLGYIDKAVAASKAGGTKPPEAWYKRAASVAYQAKLYSEAYRWTRAEVSAYPTPDNWRSALGVYRDAPGRDPLLTLDIYRLMRVTKSMAGERDYFEYASLANDRGLPGEAKAVVDEGFATSAVPSSSKALNEIRTLAGGKVASDHGSLAASARTAGAASTGRSALSTADAYLGYGEDAAAIPLYRTALQKGGIDADQANLHLGIALARSGQRAEARTVFQAVKGPRADVAAYWLLWLDMQPA